VQFLAPGIPGNVHRFGVLGQREKVHDLLGNSELNEEEQEDSQQKKAHNGKVATLRLVLFLAVMLREAFRHRSNHIRK
jgi:hypothetical protein